MPEYGVLPHVNGENIESGTCHLTYLKTAAENGMTSGKYLFSVGDVLYSKLRPYLKKVIVADFAGVCSADMYPITVNRTYLNPHFTAWMLLSDEFTKYAVEESRRARMPKINREQLLSWYSPVPPIELQERIVDILREQMKSIYILRVKLKEQLEIIKNIPSAILKKAFNGEP